MFDCMYKVQICLNGVRWVFNRPIVRVWLYLVPTVLAFFRFTDTAALVAFQAPWRAFLGWYVVFMAWLGLILLTKVELLGNCDEMSLPV